MMRKMWFGTKQLARWIKVHSPGSTYTAAGYSTRLDYLSGGVGLNRSLGGHEELQLTWNRLTSQEARDITDFAYGTYGDGPFYLSDPGAQRLNVLNKNWSMPGLSGKDGVPLAGNRRPALVSNPDQSRGYPVDMAQYRLDGTEPRRSFYVPVPPGHVAWVGVHGDPDSTGGVEVQPTVSGVQAGAATIIPVAGVDTAERVTHSFPATSDQAGIELSLEAGQPITNLFTNPSFEAGSGTVEVYRNLLTNPSFEAGSGAVEVRRNGSVNPLFVSNTWWSLPAATGTWIGDGQVSIADDAVYGALLPYESASATASPGQVWTVSRDFTVPAGFPPVALRLAVGPYAGGSAVSSEFVYSPPVTVQPGETVRLSATSAPLGATVTAIRSLAYLMEAPEAGRRIYMAKALLEKSPILGAFFSGNTSPDFDLNPSWLGAANASESVLLGVPATGYSGGSTNSAFQSTQWLESGDCSLRMVPKWPNRGSGYVDLGSFTDGKTRTAIATFYQEASTGIPSAVTARALTYITGGGASAPTVYQSAPDAAGAVQLRITFTATTTGFGYLRLYHGGMIGDPDVWWDNILIVDGAYGGPFFDGSNPHPDPDFTTAWAGAANASETVVTGVAPAALASSVTGVGKLYLSQEGAKYIIAGTAWGVGPVITGLVANATYTLLTRVRTSWTGSVRSRIGGPANSVDEPSTPVIAGEWTEIRTILPFKGGPVGVVARAGDGWVEGDTIELDYLLIVEGAYTGGYFDGGTPGASWNGAANASTSTLASRTTTLAGMIVQVLPQGVTPEPGSFISGQGMSGADFEGIVRPTPYSFDHDSYGLSVNLVETEEFL